MYVPVVVLSLLLSASAGSTHKLNVNGSVSGVDRAPTVPSLTKTLHNETDLSDIMPRPSNFTTCTQSYGVKSTCLQAGERIKGDR